MTTTNTINDRVYAYCPACGNYMYRIDGYRHGDGQVDSDDAPVWLMTDEDTIIEVGLDPAILPDIKCGCND